MIDMNKQYKTRNGHKIRLLCTDGPDSEYPVIGFVEGDCSTFEWALSGRYSADNKSGFVGVAKDRDCWVARLNIHGQRIHIGSFKCRFDAATAYNFAVEQYDRPLAKRNLVPQPWLGEVGK